MQHNQSKTVLWWGRFDPGYSRSRILRKLLEEEGWGIKDFHPTLSMAGDLEALLKGIKKPGLLWVPCCRQRDLAAASRFARMHKIPLLFDPLISAYDKRVFEKKKYAPDSWRAKRLKRWESGLFQSADAVLADTSAHADFYETVLDVNPEKVFVVPVGAEEDLFTPQMWGSPKPRVEVLFYGSFVHLQGTNVIVEAAKMVPEVDWVLLGQGKLRPGCEAASGGLSNVRFEDWVPYEQLAKRIGEADILLGVFGDTPKAMRVIPNKFYQAVACARPVITLDSPVYIPDVRSANEGGICWIPPADAVALAQAVKAWASKPDELAARGAAARSLYEKFYADDRVKAALGEAMRHL